MTLPASGAISLDDIQTEFGGSNPISLSEYYRGGSYVQSHPGTSGIAASGTIDVNMFYSKARIFYTYITLGANTTNFNLASIISTTFLSGTAISTLSNSPIYAYVTISSGIYVSGTLTSTPAFSTGTGWPSSSYIQLTNNGYIIGLGGTGGNANSGVGGAGGPALSLSYAMTLNNTSGYVYGGGGAGGAGGYGTANGVTGGGGGGGGGASSPYYPSIGGAGGGSTTVNGGAGTGGGSTPGAGGGGGYGTWVVGETTGNSNGGAGGAGGAYGAAGAAGASGDTTAGGAGGAAGNAVNLNGYTLTWTGGNNTTQVKGAVS